MPPPGHRQPLRDRPNANRRRHDPINNNINTPSPDILYRIVNETPPPPPTPTPLQPSEDKILRTIDREARIKQNQLDREARKREREESIKPNVFLPPNNIKNDIITPPPDNFKNEIIVPPQGDLKTPDDSTTLKDAKITKDNKNLYLIGGASLIAFLIIAMNKR